MKNTSSLAMSGSQGGLTLRFNLAPLDAAKIAGFPVCQASGPVDVHDFTAAYYDLNGRRLKKTGYSLSIEKAGRRKRRQVIRQLTSGAGLSSAGEEMSALASGEYPEESILQAAASAVSLHGLSAGKRFVALFTLKVKRQVWETVFEGSKMRLTLDEGYLEGRGKSRDVCVLTLSGGDLPKRFALAKKISESLPLQLDGLSYAEHGFNLLRAKPRAVLRSAQISLSPGQTPAQAFQTIARLSLRHLLANVAVFDGDARPEVVHQVRVAIRQLRVAFNLFRDILDDPLREPLRIELGWIAQELDMARATDVYINYILRPVASRYEADPDFAALLAEYMQRQKHAHDIAADLLSSRRFFHAILVLAEWIEDGTWLKVDGKGQSATIEKFAEKQLSRSWRRIRRQEKKLDWHANETLHDWRLAFKNLRYASEYFGGLYGAAAVKSRYNIPCRAGQYMSAIQDGLGQLNDIADMKYRNPLSPVAQAIYQEYLGKQKNTARQVQVNFKALRALMPYWKKTKVREA